ncbi:hypothetical protein JB92DRAFT_2826720 [Gautieria morchelliformis]|nr:hypothetical protein JB92DRAFT_2826720 [Gautieria morchelliformis]
MYYVGTFITGHERASLLTPLLLVAVILTVGQFQGARTRSKYGTTMIVRFLGPRIVYTSGAGLAMLAAFPAKNYGCYVTGATPAKKKKKLCLGMCVWRPTTGTLIVLVYVAATIWDIPVAKGYYTKIVSFFRQV